MIWTEGDSAIPVDYEVCNSKQDGVTKHDYFRKMLKTALERGFHPDYVSFDSWYSSIKNLKAVRRCGWNWLCRLKSNRLVNPDDKENIAIKEIDISEKGRVVHLKAYGMVKVFKTVSRNGDVEYWATSNVNMSEMKRLKVAEASWMRFITESGNNAVQQKSAWQEKL